jgi:hypothetical protein
MLREKKRVVKIKSFINLLAKKNYCTDMEKESVPSGDTLTLLFTPSTRVEMKRESPAGS